MQDDQLVQIAVAELADTQSATNTVFVLLVKLQHVNVLVDVIMNLPSDCKMVRALRGRTDDAVATLDVRLREFGLGLMRVVGAEERVLDHTLDAASLLLRSAFRLTLVTGFLILVPLACLMLANACGEKKVDSMQDLP